MRPLHGVFVVVAMCWGGAMAGAADESPAPLAELTLDQALTIDALVATVNGEPIFVKDIIRPLDPELQRLSRQCRSLRQFREEARGALEKQMQSAVGDILLYSAAKESLADDDEKRIDAIMNKTRNDLLAKYKGSKALADQALKTRGSSLEKELESRRRELVMEMYKRKLFYPKIEVVRRDVVREYESNVKKYTVEAEIELFTISVPVGEFLTQADSRGRMVPIEKPTVENIRKAEADATARAKDLYQKLKAGEDFAQLAELFSRDPKGPKSGGRWAHLKRGTLSREAIEKDAFAMGPNTLAEPRLYAAADPASAWVVIVKVGEVVAGRVQPFSEVQHEIDMKLREKQYQELSHSYYTKLYNQAAIDRRDQIEDMLSTATDAVVARYAVK